MDLLRPNLGHKISDRQMYDKVEHDCKSKGHECSIGEDVLAQNFRGEPKWLKATVVECTGPVSYKTQMGEQVWKQHVDQMPDKSYNQTPETSVNELKPLVLNKSYEMPKPEHSLEHSKVRERENQVRAHTTAHQTARAQMHR